ncbi:hypothetical protein ABIF65_002421 [Bradyrhizobium japonicum]|uniref:hypothetical protein n=2 Tax=Bradyrhizobium TaxID=374 RepID=UPI001BA516EF|nr:hypothetical protein [Bradyrhizobium liaoningense]MBR0879521.1 hypothetical protein [Bradyrhizobium liaoningense]
MNQQVIPPSEAEQLDKREMVPANLVDTTLPTTLKAEIDSQIATAKAFPRSIHKAIDSIVTLATLDEETAAECLYALVRRKKQQRRGGPQNEAEAETENKPIEGPSIRLAEIAAQCWGNNRIKARVITVNRKEGWVEALGVFHDLETNMASEATIRRNILTSTGRVFSNDMITVTGNAAAAIAKRNAILAGIPRGVYRKAYQEARAIVAGTTATLAQNREKAIAAFAAFGVTAEQIFDVLDVDGEGDIKVDHIATLRGMFASIKNGEATVEEMFAKEKPTEADPDRNPLVKNGGAGANDSISTGGQSNEVNGNTDKGDPRADGTSSTENRSAAVQQDSQAGAAPANETTRQASAPPAPADAGASTSHPEGSPQPDLLSGATTRDGSGQPADRQAEGAVDSRGGTTTAPTRHPASPERLQSYSKALATIENGGPAKLGKQSTAWITRNGDFDAAGNEVAGKILSIHTQRVAGEIDMAACLKRVGEIIG